MGLLLTLWWGHLWGWKLARASLLTGLPPTGGPPLDPPPATHTASRQGLGRGREIRIDGDGGGGCGGGDDQATNRGLATGTPPLFGL